MNDDLYNSLARRAMTEPNGIDLVVNDEEAGEILERAMFLMRHSPTEEEVRDAWLSVREGRAKFCGKKIVLKS